MKPKVILKSVADHYAMRDERIVEVSTRTAGCLISIREHEGVLIIEVYRADDAVEVRHSGCPGVPRD